MSRWFNQILTDWSGPLGCYVGQRYRYQQKRRRCTSADHQTIQLLQLIARKAGSATSVGWLLRYRSQIRHVRQLSRRVILSFIIEQTDRPDVLRYAIWLRGRNRGTIGTLSIASRLSEMDASTRKEAVRALKRLSAWTTLHRLAATDADESVRRLATSTAPADFSGRLAAFTRNVSHIDCPNRRQALNLIPTVDPIAGRPPRTAQQIRATLLGIQRRLHST